MDGSSYESQENNLAILGDAISLVSTSRIEELLWNTAKKEELRNAENTIQDFLSRTRIQANLLTWNYQTGIKMVTPIFFDSDGKLSELPYLNILVALLARLKKQTKTKFPIQQSDDMTRQLDAIVDSFIGKNGTSPNDATAILGSPLYTHRKSQDTERAA